MMRSRLAKRWVELVPIWGTAVVLVMIVAGWAEGTLGIGRLSPVYAALLERSSLFATAFMAIFIEGLPFLLLGALAAGLVDVFFEAEAAPNNASLGALSGALLGLVIPVGKAGAVPLARQLLRKGAPVSLGMALCFAAPALNPVALVVTYSVFGFGTLFWGRIGLTLVLAVVLGVLFSGAERGDVLREDGPSEGGDAGIEQVPPALRLQKALSTAGDVFFDLGRFLVLGALLAAFLQTVIPSAGLMTMGQQSFFAVLAMAGLAVLLSVGATEDAFVVLAFVGILPVGALLAFLVLGPVVDLPQVLALLRVFKARMVLYAVLLVVLVTLAAGYAINLGGVR